jgi:hypothetical protein
MVFRKESSDINAPNVEQFFNGIILELKIATSKYGLRSGY